MTEVAVLGGGIGGLSAAHELAERGFSVTVYETADKFGGKARSFPGPRPSGTALPAEHGFRFFPGFYQHVTDTMSRIPHGGGTVADNLVETTQILQATTGQSWTVATAPPRTLLEHRRRMRSLFGGPDVPPDEKAFFLNRLLHLLSSSERRWREEYDHVSWWEFVNADQMSEAYRKILGRGISQLLVALRPEKASTRTMGRIYLQLIQGLFDESMTADYVLNGPTNDVWIDPWVSYLEDVGVELRTGATVRAIESDGERVTGVRISEERTGDTPDAGPVRDADYCVAALPVEVMQRLVTPELGRAAPSLRGISRLETAWMNGIQFYLDRDVRLANGHGIYFDSPWALTTISQRQFWTDRTDSYFHGEAEGVLSVCISDWERPGVLYGKPARECSPTEIKDEVWAQLERHLDSAAGPALTDDLVVDWFLDPAVEYDPQREKARSREPLFINTVGSYQHRPPAATAAPNLLLAADYVRTNADLACMEGANEAARRAVNAIIERSGSDADRCEVETLSFPPTFDALRRMDDVFSCARLPHPGGVTPKIWRAYSLLDSVFTG
jgi:uncharacterized protein with NAD-binding domain and iron-sulfur cluster